MKFVAGGMNKTYLRAIHETGIEQTESVKIAVAYASGEPLILKNCLSRGIKVTYWCRYDDTSPVSLNILKKFLDRKSPNYVCMLVPDIFHAKVIWWKGYGAYIGSANLTERAWMGNIEAGVFFEESELIENSMLSDMEVFFSELQSRSTQLSESIFRELSALRQANRDVDRASVKAREHFNNNRTIPRMPFLSSIDHIDSQSRARNEFMKEWGKTLQILKDIASRVSQDQYRPIWVKKDVPSGVQADQFLHAYYYSKVLLGKRVKRKHWESHQKNVDDPEKALVDAMTWWSKLKEPPSNEDEHIYDWAPVQRHLLSKDILTSLSCADFHNFCSRVFALRDHALRISYSSYGLIKALPSMDESERITYFANWLYEQRSTGNQTVMQTLDYVLWGGRISEVSERIYKVSVDEYWKIPHLGVSSLGEIVGWALPDHFPPRNGRTSKALTALGYDVEIHTE